MESFAPTRESFAITRDEDDTALKAVEVDMPHRDDDPPHKPKRFTHMLLDILGHGRVVRERLRYLTIIFENAISLKPRFQALLFDAPA